MSVCGVRSISSPRSSARLASSSINPWSYNYLRPSINVSGIVPSRNIPGHPHRPRRCYRYTPMVQSSISVRFLRSEIAWAATVTHHVSRFLVQGPGVRTAARLIGSSLFTSKSATYQRLWTSFASFCHSSKRTALPSAPATLCAYLGVLFYRGSLQVSSMRPYLAFIMIQHRRLEFPDPTTIPLVLSTRHGFFAADAARHNGAPPRTSPYPASAAFHFVHASLHPLASKDNVSL